MFYFLLVIGAILVYRSVGLWHIEVENKNGFPIWIQTRTNPGAGGDLPYQNVKLEPNGGKIKYDIQDSG